MEARKRSIQLYPWSRGQQTIAPALASSGVAPNLFATRGTVASGTTQCANAAANSIIIGTAVAIGAAVPPPGRAFAADADAPNSHPLRDPAARRATTTTTTIAKARRRHRRDRRPRRCCHDGHNRDDRRRLDRRDHRLRRSRDCQHFTGHLARLAPPRHHQLATLADANEANRRLRPPHLQPEEGQNV